MKGRGDPTADNGAMDASAIGAQRRIGIFGGTFDPPHIGHCIVAQELHSQLGLHELLIVPAAMPPHKRSRPVAAAAVRLEMVEAAFGGDARFGVSDLEIRRSGESYTVDTLRELRAAKPDARLFVGIGADQLAEIDTWRDPQVIEELATIVGFARAGKLGTGVDRRAKEVVKVPAIGISSTDIRDRVRRGMPIRFLVPSGVEEIIVRERLYQTG